MDYSQTEKEKDGYRLDSKHAVAVRGAQEVAKPEAD